MILRIGLCALSVVRCHSDTEKMLFGLQNNGIPHADLFNYIFFEVLVIESDLLALKHVSWRTQSGSQRHTVRFFLALSW